MRVDGRGWGVESFFRAGVIKSSSHDVTGIADWASLLEVGTGFHPELTGRENVFLNRVILGMKRAEITTKYDEIVAFAEIGEFMSATVATYLRK